MCYRSEVDPPETSIPVCTLKSFPSLIEHTLQVPARALCRNGFLARGAVDDSRVCVCARAQWGRDAFEEHYRGVPDEVNGCVPTRGRPLPAARREGGVRCAFTGTSRAALRRISPRLTRRYAVRVISFVSV